MRLNLIRIETSSAKGASASIKVKSGNKIRLGLVRSNLDFNNGNAAKIDLNISGDIETGAVASNVFAGLGKGGNISLISDNGNIVSDYLRSDSVSGTGGNITLDAAPKLGTSGGTVRVINSINIDGADFSIFAGINGDPKIKISYFPPSFPSSDLTGFIIGDASVNGTKGIILAGTDVIVDTSVIDGPYTLGNIKINTIIQIADTPLLTEIKKRVQKSYVEALKPIGIDLAARQALNGTGIPAVVSHLLELRRLWASRGLTITAASSDSKYGEASDKLKVANSAFFDIERILKSASKYGVTDRAQIAYIIATASWESQFGTIDLSFYNVNHNPLYESSRFPIGSQRDKIYFGKEYDNRTDLGNRGVGSGDGFRYRGRGYVQLTGRGNYTRFQQIFGVDITSTSNEQTVKGQTQYSDEGDPDRVATDRNLAADILVLGIRDNLFTQTPFANLRNLTEQSHDFQSTRMLINGLDNANAIALNAELYFQILI